jgi:prepilin-type N-terminal cleavage/methylation domain-containing protein
MNRPRSGFTLLELLAVMACLGIVLCFGTVLLVASMRTDRMIVETMGQVRRHSELADQFREDVAKAIDAPAEAAAHVAGSNCLILQQPGNVYVIYRDLPDYCEQITIRPGSVTKRPLIHSSIDSKVEFSRSGPSNSIITLHVRETVAHRKPKDLAISAYVGGDRK